MNGIGGLTITVSETGHLENFFSVYASEKAMANVLSFAEVEDRFKITYLPGEGFVVHLKDRDILFARVGKLYVAKWDDVMIEASSHLTTQESESRYTMAEVKRAKQAYELASASGYPLVKELVDLVEDGNVSGIPGITRADIRRAFEIYGAPVAYVREKMTKRKVSRAVYRTEDCRPGSGHVLGRYDDRWTEVLIVSKCAVAVNYMYGREGRERGGAGYCLAGSAAGTKRERIHAQDGERRPAQYFR